MTFDPCREQFMVRHTPMTFSLKMLVAQSCLTVSPWTVAYQAPLSMGFSRQEYWSGLPFLSPWDLPSRGMQPWFSLLQVDSLPFELPTLNS